MEELKKASECSSHNSPVTAENSQPPDAGADPIPGSSHKQRLTDRTVGPASHQDLPLVATCKERNEPFSAPGFKLGQGCLEAELHCNHLQVWDSYRQRHNHIVWYVCTTGDRHEEPNNGRTAHCLEWRQQHDRARCSFELGAELHCPSHHLLVQAGLMLTRPLG